MDFYTTKEIADKWGISARRVAVLCEEKRIEGAEKKGKTWLIPIDTMKPDDGRYKRMRSYVQFFNSIEKKYNMIYPGSENATYSSLLNFSDDLSKPFQRWYRYKEGFSIELVETLIKNYSKDNDGIIMDPFSGSGSTLLAANKLGYKSCGFETNPFSFFLSRCKLDNYSKRTIESFKQAYEQILDDARKNVREYKLPKLSISHKVFNPEVEKYFMSIGSLIETQNDMQIKNLLKLGWLACLEPLCNYRKAGNGLKIKKYVKPRIITCDDVRVTLLEEYQNIYIDLLKREETTNSKIYNESCLSMDKYIKNSSLEGIIFSPPYANCFDYTEIYKLELWFGKFVTEYSQLKELRKKSLHSHLNGDLSINTEEKSETLEKLLRELEKKELWDKRIPKMLRLYYDDMFRVIEKSYNCLRKKGFCCIVVGNSAYGGIVFPADLIMAEYAEKIGFEVDKIEIDRFIITSSQQYNETKETGKYLRESIVCLVKK